MQQVSFKMLLDIVFPLFQNVFFLLFIFLFLKVLEKKMWISNRHKNKHKMLACSSESSFNKKMGECVSRNFWPFLQKGIDEVTHWSW